MALCIVFYYLALIARWLKHFFFGKNKTKEMIKMKRKFHSFLTRKKDIDWVNIFEIA